MERQMEQCQAESRSLADKLSERRDVDESAREQQAEATSKLQNRLEQIAGDMDTILSVIPKIEEAMLRGDGALQEKVTAVVHEVSRVDDVLAAERARTAAAIE